VTTGRRLTVRAERWPVRGGAFTISRGSVDAVEVVVVGLEEGGRVGLGECRPYPRYGETPAGTAAEIEGVRRLVEGGADRAALARVLAPAPPATRSTAPFGTLRPSDAASPSGASPACPSQRRC
jgi:hypothetical protein